MNRIRLAVPDDAGGMLDIYAPFVRDTVVTFEYEVPSLEQFRERIECCGSRSGSGSCCGSICRSSSFCTVFFHDVCRESGIC